MSVSKYMFLLALLCLAASLSGCGGGGGGNTAILATASTLSVIADTAPDLTQSTSKISTQLSTKDATTPTVLAGATVQVRDFVTGTVLKSGTLDSSGKFTTSITPDSCLLVVAAGTLGGKRYRLSTIIPSVAKTTQDCRMDPVTSMAAEALAHQFYTRQRVDQSTFNTVKYQALLFAQQHQSVDYSTTSGAIISGATVGANGLTSTAAEAVQNAVPSKIGDDLTNAKNAVLQIKGIGQPFVDLTSMEADSVQDMIPAAVQNGYGQMTDRLSTMIAPAIIGNMWVSPDYKESSVFNLTLGHAYTGTTYGDWIDIQDSGSAAQGNEIDISATSWNDTATHTLTAVKSSTGWTITEHSSADSSLVYRLTTPLTDGSATLPYSVHLTMTDRNLTSPISFTGTFSATGSDYKHWSQTAYTGSFQGPCITSTGTYQATFAPTLPAGASSGDSLMKYPTRFTITNSQMTVTDGTRTATLSGGLTANAKIANDENGHPKPWPTDVTMTGTYSSSTGLAFNGTFTATWTNAGPSVGARSAIGTAGIIGTMTRSGYPGYNVTLNLGANQGALSANTISLGWGSNTLNGTASGTLTRVNDSDRFVIANGSVTLTNQDGTKIHLTSDSSGKFTGGSITCGNNTEATVTKSGSGLCVTYTDGAIDRF